MYNRNDVFENLKDGICTINMNGEVIYANSALYNILNSRRNDMVGEKIWSEIPYIPANDGFIQLLIDTVFEKKRNHEAIVDFDRGDGHIRKLRVCVSYGNDKIEYMLIIITDLTQLFKMNKALVSYLSADVADILMNSENAEEMGNTLKNVTVLVSDIRGFTSLSEKIDPDIVVRILNHYLEAMNEIAMRNHGMVDNIMGDGMLIVFGAAKDNPCHALDAIKCALDMQTAMKELNEWYLSQGYPSIEIGVGINTGNVVVGNIGSQQRLKFTCIGGAVNLASRIQGYAKGGQILISSSTADCVPGKIKIGDSLTVNPKGISRDVLLYEVCGLI